MKYKDVKSVYFIGICGTAMASLAAMMQDYGISVSGSDVSVYPPMSDFLLSRKIKVHKGYSPDHLAINPDLVIIGNAVTRGNPEVEYVLNYKLEYTSMAGALQDFFLWNRYPVVITGTHGKTTTSSMMAACLEKNGFSPSFLIGGITQNFNMSGRYVPDSKYIVLEGDEYDTAFFDKSAKFLHYMPYLLIINNLEYDHCDIYPDFEALKLQFSRLVRTVPSNGTIFVCGDESEAALVSKNDHTPCESYGFSASNKWRAVELDTLHGKTEFTALKDEKIFARFTLNMTGDFNVVNALSVIAASSRIGLDKNHIIKGIAAFKGVKRRMEVLHEKNGITIIDDFAHHPTAIEKTIQACRQRFPDKKIWTILEPRSWSMRRGVFQDRLSSSLQGSDRVIIANVFGLEKMDKMNRLEPRKIIKELNQKENKALFLKDTGEIISYIKENIEKNTVLLIMSNGGFDNIHNRLIDAL